MNERKQWEEHHHEGLAKAIENLLHAAGCPTVKVEHSNSHGLSVMIDFEDFEDDTIDNAILWAISARHGRKP